MNDSPEGPTRRRGLTVQPPGLGQPQAVNYHGGAKKHPVWGGLQLRLQKPTGKAEKNARGGVVLQLNKARQGRGSGLLSIIWFVAHVCARWIPQQLLFLFLDLQWIGTAMPGHPKCLGKLLDRPNVYHIPYVWWAPFRSLQPPSPALTSSCVGALRPLRRLSDHFSFFCEQSMTYDTCLLLRNAGSRAPLVWQKPRPPCTRLSATRKQTCRQLPNTQQSDEADFKFLIPTERRIWMCLCATPSGRPTRICAPKSAHSVWRLAVNPAASTFCIQAGNGLV